MSESHHCSLTIINKLGLHARAAAKFVNCASGFAAAITIRRAEREVDGKSIMGVMMLAAAKGVQIDIIAKGEDATLPGRGRLWVGAVAHSEFVDFHPDSELRMHLVTGFARAMRPSEERIVVPEAAIALGGCPVGQREPRQALGDEERHENRGGREQEIAEDARNQGIAV